MIVILKETSLIDISFTICDLINYLSLSLLKQDYLSMWLIIKTLHFIIITILFYMH